MYVYITNKKLKKNISFKFRFDFLCAINFLLRETSALFHLRRCCNEIPQASFTLNAMLFVVNTTRIIHKEKRQSSMIVDSYEYIIHKHKRKQARTASYYVVVYDSKSHTHNLSKIDEIRQSASREEIETFIQSNRERER